MEKTLRLEIQILSHGESLPLPSYETEGAAGMDLAAALPESEPLLLAPFARAVVPTGLAIGLPVGYEAQIRPRSGLAAKNGVTVLNAPGTIDADYRGEVKVLLVNLGSETFTIRRGMRIAQLVLSSVLQAQCVQEEHLAESRRGDRGFGSTGLYAGEKDEKQA